VNVGPTGKPVTLADTDEDLLVHGRIGYGTRTPWMLGGLLLLAVIVIGVAGWFRNQDEPGPRMAPEFTMTQFDGRTFRLSEHRGKVVVVNFWASWCEPCREEMPALQEASTLAGDDVVFVGVGAKTDKDDEAQAFAQEYGVTYPIGRDTEGGGRADGAIQMAFEVYAFPATYVITPDGRIDTVLITAITASDDLLPLIEAARKPD
jgi:thiol-disulfide isomerase/thioredoxin